MNTAKNYLYAFDEIADRRALVRPLTLTYAPDTQHERQVPSRFRAIVDGTTGAQLAAVSDRYTLVQNEDIVTAVERAGDVLGVRLEKSGGMYRNGVTKLRWLMPDHTFEPGGTQSPITPTFEAGNDYGAGGSVLGEGGLWVTLCSNGMRRLMWSFIKKMRHVGIINVDVLYTEYATILSNVMNKLEDNKQVISLLASTEVNDAWIDRVVGSLRESRQPVMISAIKSNVSAHGATAWALAQAVTEASTHQFPNTWANQDWAAKQVEKLIGDVQRVNA